MLTPIETPPDAMRGAIDTLLRNEAALREYIAIDARLRWQKFRALIEQGFTAEQALALSSGPLLQA